VPVRFRLEAPERGAGTEPARQGQDKKTRKRVGFDSGSRHHQGVGTEPRREAHNSNNVPRAPDSNPAARRLKKPDSPMANYNAPFEIHVHGDVPLRADVTYAQLQEALKPLWKYAGAKSLADAAESAYEEEPGIKFDATEHLLRMCWTVPGDEDFRQSLDEMCMSLNELSEQGAAIEVTFYDAEFDEEEEPPEAESRDDFVMLFVGPTPAAIMQVQRDLLVEDVINLMERHFDASELSGVVGEIDKLFAQRFDALVNSLEIGKPPRGTGGPGGSGHGGGRRPRHLH
jgi:hypothetical protein